MQAEDSTEAQPQRTPRRTQPVCDSESEWTERAANSTPPAPPPARITGEEKEQALGMRTQRKRLKPPRRTEVHYHTRESLTSPSAMMHLAGTGTPPSSHPKIIISSRHPIPNVFIIAAENVPFQYLLEVR